MSKKVKTTIKVEYEGFPSKQFGDDEDWGGYRPSGFLQVLLGKAAEQFKDLSHEVTECSLTVSGYKVTIGVEGRDS